MATSLPPVGNRDLQRQSMGMQGGYGGNMQGGGGMPYGGNQMQQPQGGGPNFQYTNPQFSVQPIQPPTLSPNMSPTVQSPTSSTQGGHAGMSMHRPSNSMQGMPQGNNNMQQQQQFTPSPSNQALSTLVNQPSNNNMNNMGPGMQQSYNLQQPPFGGMGATSMQAPFNQNMLAPMGGQQYNNPSAQQYNNGMMGQGNYGMGGMGNMGGPMGMGGPMSAGMANNPMMKGAGMRSQVPEQWRTGIADFFDDCFTCGVGTCLTGFLYGENYQKIYGYGFSCACAMYTIFPCFACCFANQTRAELRKKYNLLEEPCGDCCIHFFCSPCAVCQEARELRIRERWISVP